MSLPVVLRPEATKDAAEAIDYFDALRPGLGQAFLIQVQDVLLRISGCPRYMASSGGTCVRRDCGASPMSSITVCTQTVWRCWPWSKETVTLLCGKAASESPSRPNQAMQRTRDKIGPDRKSKVASR